MIDQILLLAASVVANALSAFAGGGAGLVQLPVILLMGLPFPSALATHKVVTIALGLGAFARMAQDRDLIEPALAAVMLICGIAGVILGAYIVIQVPEGIALKILGILTIGIGLYSAAKRGFGQTYIPKNRELRGLSIGGVALFAIGVFNGSFSAGSGLFVTAFLIAWFGMDYRRAVAYTMIVNGIFWNGAGGAALVAFGAPVHWAWVPVLLAGSFAGGYIGAHAGALKGNRWIKHAFTAVTLASGAALLLR